MYFTLLVYIKKNVRERKILVTFVMCIIKQGCLAHFLYLNFEVFKTVSDNPDWNNHSQDVLVLS